jgi:hypothetical protein
MSTGEFRIECPILTRPMFARRRTVKAENDVKTGLFEG